LQLIRFLVPGTTGKFRCGGLLVELQTARLVSRFATVEIVTYRQRESDHPFLADLLRVESVHQGVDQPLWIVSWGFDVPKLLRLLKRRPVAYHAHSSGYGFALPSGTPVLAVSRNTLGYWGDRSPRSPLFLVPNALETKWIERGAWRSRASRPIDVLVQRRKNSRYVLNELVPALRAEGLRVEVQDGWVEDLVGLFNDATVYLYDSADYWHSRGVSEGFGLPPMEALACGCVVFSSLNHALSDLLDPGIVGHQIGAGMLCIDVERIKAAVAAPNDWKPADQELQELLNDLNESVLLERWRMVLARLGEYWRLRLAGERPLHSSWLHRHALWSHAAALSSRVARAWGRSVR
jgi:hypothetical protein